MKNIILISLLIPLIVFDLKLNAQERIDSILPVRGLSISVPSPTQVDSFTTFINKEL
jgi:hypothetical protein